MSRYVCYYSGRRAMYREFAARWLRWAATHELTEEEITGVALFFKSIGKRFGLITEFREMGLL